MPNINGMTDLFKRPEPLGNPPQLQTHSDVQSQAVPAEKSYPPVPQLKNQKLPTEISMRDLKYNAFNVDQLSFNITSRQGFDGKTPDLVIWNFYQYNVTQLKASADEKELSGFLNWSMQELGLKDLNVDFHPGQQLSVSGKYPLMGVPVPFTAQLSLSVQADQKLLMTVSDFKAGFSLPAKLRDTLIDLFVSGGGGANASPPPDSVGDAFSLKDALQKVGPNQILVDFSRMKVPVQLPINKFETTEQGFSIEGGSAQP